MGAERAGKFCFIQFTYHESGLWRGIACKLGFFLGVFCLLMRISSAQFIRGATNQVVPSYIHNSDSLPLVYNVYRCEELLRWCLDRGARVDYADIDPPNVPPLLEYVAKGGTISSLKLLMEHGTKLGPRTLHRAVEGASSGASERMEMVRFLVEDIGCDVNGMDMPEDKRYPAHYGTPLNHAACVPGAVEVVKYLLGVSFTMWSEWVWILRRNEWIWVISLTDFDGAFRRVQMRRSGTVGGSMPLAMRDLGVGVHWRYLRSGRSRGRR